MSQHRRCTWARLVFVTCALFVGVFFPPPTVQAADGTWINPVTGGAWGTDTNWLNGIIADGADATANFNTLDLTANNTVTFDAPHTLGFLNFAATTPNFNWILT